MTTPLPQMPPAVLPEVVPDALPQPKFQLGEWVRWQAVPNADFGRVIGLLYSYETAHQIDGLHYLILLDPQSPSRSICLHDFAFEDDLERFEHPLHQHEVSTGD